MELSLLKVSECHESETNPRGKDFEGKQFDELVSSIKEKGVLVPVLAREVNGKGTDWHYEVIAGNRRLRAAKAAGLKEIPAQVVDMSDDEAREAQIVENLQRQDVHPLEEGEAYRQLIEDGGRTVKDVAIKVGKPEDYVRQRLFLTNLVPVARDYYRKGELLDAAAYLVAKLGPNDQVATIERMKEGWRGMTFTDLKKWIQEHFYHPLAFQPWIKDAEIGKLVGTCKECPPSREALFGTVKDGQCTDVKCWRRKMDIYLTHRVKAENLVPVVKQYGKPDRMKFAGLDVLTESNYKGLPSNRKKQCDFAAQGIVIDGPDTGSTIWVCADSQCKEHHYQHSEYKPSEKEKAKRKQEREKDEARRQKFDNAITTTLLENVKWPLSEKHLDALLDLVLDQVRVNGQMPIAKRHAVKPEKGKADYGPAHDYATPLRRIAEQNGNTGKLCLIFELLLPSYWMHTDDKEMKKKIARL